MKRSGFKARRSPLRKASTTPRARLLYLADELARIVCMVNAGACWVEPESGALWRGRTWFGVCPARPQLGVTGLQWAHILGRGYRAVRHHPENAVALSREAHVHFTHRPVEWRNWVTDMYGAERLATIEDAAQHYQKVSLETVVEELETECRMVGASQHAEWARERASRRGAR